MKKATEILMIGFGGETAAIILSRVNDVLEFCVLSATLIGIIWKIFKHEINGNNNERH